MNSAAALAQTIGAVAACRALRVPRASFYRVRNPKPDVATKPRPQPARALGKSERQTVVETLTDDRFADLAPAEVYGTLLDEGVYLCSIRSMYRILEQQGQVRERRNQARHGHYAKPELLATGPNQVWSWDITKLRGPAKWSYFYLYVILDIFSRMVTGWMVASREAATLANRLIADSCTKQGIEEGQLTLHADRGSAMKSKDVALLLADLGVAKTHSRPYTSDDNPFSESQFKTLKYRPGFPERFGCIEDARAFCRDFFAWYNEEHRHSGIGLLTPATVHYGLAQQVRQQRQNVLDTAYRKHPERFVRKPPMPPELPQAVWINPPQRAAQTTQMLPNFDEDLSQNC